MMEFIVRAHVAREAQVVEIWRDGKFVGQITPSDNGGVRVMSKYLDVGKMEGWSFTEISVDIPLEQRAVIQI